MINKLKDYRFDMKEYAHVKSLNIKDVPDLDVISMGYSPLSTNDELQQMYNELFSCQEQILNPVQAMIVNSFIKMKILVPIEAKECSCDDCACGKS